MNIIYIEQLTDFSMVNGKFDNMGHCHEEDASGINRIQYYHDYLQHALPKEVFVKYRRAYIRNISYSLQYMKYISNIIKISSPHFAVKSQLRKTFIITGCSVIESILWILLKGRKLNKKSMMRFIEMCRDAKKMKLLGVSSDVYLKLYHLRHLRNRVHINSVQHDRDNDFWVFEDKDIKLMKKVLRSILKSEIFSPYDKYDELFDWL